MIEYFIELILDELQPQTCTITTTSYELLFCKRVSNREADANKSKKLLAI